MTQPLPVDVSASFAHTAGQDVHVVLCLTDLADLADLAEPTVLRLTSAKRTVRAPVTARTTAEGTVLESSVPAASLRPAVWSLALVSGEREARRVQPLEARLLTSRKQPLALLPGPTPATRMPAPRPRTQDTRGGHWVTVDPRVRATMVRSVDGALSVLPEQVAARYRDRLGRLGRRVLG